MGIRLKLQNFKRGGTIKKVCVPKIGFRQLRKVCVPKIGFGLNLKKFVYLKSGPAEKLRKSTFVKHLSLKLTF